MKIVPIIFGASGFVGRNLMLYLSQHNPIGIDKKNFNKEYKKFYKNFYKSDVFDLTSIPIDKNYYVINLMAELGSPNEEKNIRNNLESVKYLYSIIKKTKRKCYGIVHFSSISAERGASYYGRTKMQAENIVKLENIPYIILQSEMIIGNGARSIDKLKRGLNLFPFISFLPRGGNVYRYPIDIKNVCETTHIILKNNIFDNNTYHLVAKKTTMKKISEQYTNNFILPIPSFFLLLVARILEILFKNPMFTYDNAIGVCSDTKLKLKIINQDVIKKINEKA